MNEQVPADQSTKSAQDFATQFKTEMRCNCDLDNWEPERSTGHSWVCRIHRHATAHYNAQFNGGHVRVVGVSGHDDSNQELGRLLDQIRDFSSPNVFNPWSDSDPLDAYGKEGASHRVARLAQHFSCLPRFLLIGEAPGYQGCHFSGVPFTNEALLLEGAVPRVPCHVRITTRPLPWREPSATIVWKELHALGIAESTVMWNAFAWHPHKPGEPMSNRAPTRAELNAGSGVLRAVLKHFDQCRYIAVGNVAKAALDAAGISVFATVRHPSMGGATKFREQMRALGAREAA